MLVLSRRVNERLLIPCIQTTVQVIAARPTGVRLGIEAPPEVTVLRAEIAAESVQGAADVLADTRDESGVRHRLLNRLKNLSVGLALIRHCARSSSVEELQTALDTMDSEFEGLRRQLTLLIRQNDEDSGEPVTADSWRI